MNSNRKWFEVRENSDLYKSVFNATVSTVKAIDSGTDTLLDGTAEATSIVATGVAGVAAGVKHAVSEPPKPTVEPTLVVAPQPRIITL